jgi:hypothetical protein
MSAMSHCLPRHRYFLWLDALEVLVAYVPFRSSGRDPWLRRLVGSALVTLAVTCLALVTVSVDETTAKAGGGKSPLRLGLFDTDVFQSSDASERALWFDRAAAAGTDTIELLADWRSILKNNPPAEPTNPADPAYGFAGLDNAVRDAAARGFRIVIWMTRAPDFAEGPDRAPDAPTGTWKPSPQRLAEFATALATRYSGSFPDPNNPGASLPRVSFWEIWAEPNLSTHLTPQTENGKVVGPEHFRAMVNAASSALKAVSGSNQVIGGATAPFGDHPPASRTPPLTFWTKFFCLRGKKLKAQRKCRGGKPRVDAFSSNPLAGLAGNELLPTLGPADKAPDPTDILIPDMHKLYDVLTAARKQKMVKPRKGTELWVSELLWETNPPDESAKGVSLDNQAAYLAQSLQSLRRQGVSEVHWVKIRDEAPNPGFQTSLQSGLYFHDGTPKPALQSFHSP